MPNFVVTFAVVGRKQIEVEAKDWEEAETIARDKITFDDFEFGIEFGDIELVDIEED